MKKCINILTISTIIFFGVPLSAQIYYWIDANGVQHFSNYSLPPADAKNIGSKYEAYYDKEADIRENKKSKQSIERNRRQYKKKHEIAMKKSKQVEAKGNAAKRPKKELKETMPKEEKKTIRRKKRRRGKLRIQ